MGEVVVSGAGSVYAKIAQVMGELKSVPKTGYNSFQNYSYVKGSDIADLVRPVMAKFGLALVPSVVSAEIGPSKTSTDKDCFLATVNMLFTLGDESGGEVKSAWVGQAQDTGDKAIYKAYSGAIKYFLMETFSIGSEDDPELEATRGKGNYNQGNRSQQGGQRPQGQLGNPTQGGQRGLQGNTQQGQRPQGQQGQQQTQGQQGQQGQRPQGQGTPPNGPKGGGNIPPGQNQAPQGQPQQGQPQQGQPQQGQPQQGQPQQGQPQQGQPQQGQPQQGQPQQGQPQQGQPQQGQPQQGQPQQGQPQQGQPQQGQPQQGQPQQGQPQQGQPQQGQPQQGQPQQGQPQQGQPQQGQPQQGQPQQNQAPQGQADIFPFSGIVKLTGDPIIGKKPTMNGIMDKTTIEARTKDNQAVVIEGWGVEMIEHLADLTTDQFLNIKDAKARTGPTGSLRIRVEANNFEVHRHQQSQGVA